MSTAINKCAMDVYKGIQEIYDRITDAGESENLNADVELLEDLQYLVESLGPLEQMWILGDAISKLEEVSQLDLADKEKLAAFMLFFKEPREVEAHVYH